MTDMDLRTDNEEGLAWQAERDAAAAAYLAALPGRTTLAERINRHLVDTRRSPVIRRGDRWFQTVVLEANAEHPVLVVRDAPAGDPRVLVDPNELSAKRRVPTTLGWFVPSPDGSVLAYAVTAAGTEVYEVSLLDVTTGELLPETVPWNVNFPVSWLPDSSGFWCAGR
jgi:prolyl oligopeptidase